jgi:hypothetical protein
LKEKKFENKRKKESVVSLFNLPLSFSCFVNVHIIKKKKGEGGGGLAQLF